MSARRHCIHALLVSLFGVALLAMWTTGWLRKHPLEPSGGLYFPRQVLVPVPQFLQTDAAWADHRLGATPDSLARVGCAVTSAAMVLAAYGIDTDPGRLNAFLAATPGGYTPEGWLYWEKAAEIDATQRARLLPHYEDAPSYFLIDWNLYHGNPVIVRVRYPGGVTHFMVVCGKRGFDYLVRDPGAMGKAGIYPMKDFGSPIEALRFYRNPRLAVEQE